MRHENSTQKPTFFQEPCYGKGYRSAAERHERSHKKKKTGKTASTDTPTSMLQQHVHIKFASPSKCSRVSQGNEGALSDTGVFSCEGKKERKRFWPAAAFAGHNIVRKDLFYCFKSLPFPDPALTMGHMKAYGM